MRLIAMYFALLLGVLSVPMAAQTYLKIYTKAEGIHRITGEDLQAAGVGIAEIDPATLQLFSDGQRPLPIPTTGPRPDLREVAIRVNSSDDGSFGNLDYLEFYAQALNRFEWSEANQDFEFLTNPYDTEACYWLRWNLEPGNRMSTEDGTPEEATRIRRTFTDYLRLEEDQHNLFKAGLTWTWNTFDSEAVFTHTFNLSGVESPTASIEAHFFNFEFYSHPRRRGSARLAINRTGQNTAFRNQARILGDFPIQNGLNLLHAEYLPAADDTTAAYRGLDWVELRYQRSTRLHSNEMTIYSEPTSGLLATAYRSEGDIGQIDIFDVRNPFDPIQITTSDQTYFQDDMESKPGIHYLKRTGFFHRPVRIENAQRGRLNYSGGNYLVIVPAAWKTTVLPLVDHRRTASGFTVQVVTTEEIRDEYGFGRNDPIAIRNFLRHAAATWHPRPEYVVFAGSGYFDYRNITGEYPNNWVPTYEISGLNNIDTRNIDDLLLDLQRDAQSSLQTIKADIAFGRFPADTEQQLSNMIEKTIRSETEFEPGLWRLQALMIADDEYAGNSSTEFFHLEQIDNRYTPFMESAGFQRITAYSTVYPLVNGEKPDLTRELVNAINHGNRFTIFKGHGGPNQLTHENILNFDRDMGKIRNTNLMFYLGLCSFKWNERRNGLCYDLLRRKDTGLFAAVIPGYPIFSFQSELFYVQFLDELFGNSQGILGKTLINAKGAGTNDQKYALLGDPAAVVCLPEERIFINDIKPDTIRANSLVEISGTVIDGAREDLLLVEVREPGKIFTTTQGTNHELNGSALYRGQVAIENGSFNLRFIASADLADSVALRGRINAYTWNGAREGRGVLRDIPIGGRVEGIDDNSGPEIDMRIEQYDDGPYLVAELFDKSGINLSGLQGNEPVLFIDDNRDAPYYLSEFFTYERGSYQRGILKYPLPTLTAGLHSATLVVHDNQNNPSSDSVSVVTTIEQLTETIADKITLGRNYPNPFNPVTAIPFSLAGNAIYQVRLEIYNTLGQRVAVLLNQSMEAGDHTVEWQGLDQGGQQVASGVYIYRLWASSHAPAAAPQQRGSVYQESRKLLLLK